MSSFGELEYACSTDRPVKGTNKIPKYLDWNTNIVSKTPFPITEYQPIYFISESLESVSEKIKEYCKIN